jgi:hypothetical protein
VARTPRLYLTLSRVGLALAWLPAAVVSAFLGGFAVAIEEPWPLSRRQGPDTEHARELFAATFGFSPSSAVVRLYGRNEWAGFGEHVISIAFEWTDEQVVGDIIARLMLEPVPEAEVKALRVFPGPAWWPPSEELSRLREAYRNPQGSEQMFTHVWIDRARRRMYFQDVDVA